jgi:hypothetical protein
MKANNYGFNTSVVIILLKILIRGFAPSLHDVINMYTEFTMSIYVRFILRLPGQVWMNCVLLEATQYQYFQVLKAIMSFLYCLVGIKPFCTYRDLFSH